MKPKLILCLALVLSGLFCFHAAAQTISETNKSASFPPILQPITNADSTIVHLISVHVPTQLKIERTTDTLSIEIDTKKFETTNFMVGTNMVTGVQSTLFIYLAGEPRPTDWFGKGLTTGLDFNLGKDIVNAKLNGIPQVGKSYVVEMDLAAFETDIPSQHLWEPHSKNYKVIWQRSLKQFVK